MSQNPFSGIKDVDMMILLNLTDYELTRVCQVNKYVNSICKDDNFWLKRILQTAQSSLESNLEAYSQYASAVDVKSVNRVDVDEARNFYGFGSYSEFYKFIVEAVDNLPQLIYYIIIFPKLYPNVVKKLYRINSEKLPKWIIYEDLIYYIKRKLLKNILAMEYIPPQLIVDVPGFRSRPRNQKYDQSLMRVLRGLPAGTMFLE